MVNQILIKFDEKRYLSQFLCAPQYKLKRFVTMTTYWVPDLSNIKGFSGHLWHSILIFANKALYGGRRGSLMVSALDSGASSPGSSPGWEHCVVFLGKTLYSHSMGKLLGKPNKLRGRDLLWTSIPSRGK